MSAAGLVIPEAVAKHIADAMLGPGSSDMPDRVEMAVMALTETSRSLYDTWVAPLPTIVRPDGRVYRPRKLAVEVWESDYECGAVVFGTNDPTVAQPLATDAIRREFDNQMIAALPRVGWWRDGYEAAERRWIQDDVRGRAGVYFTASYPAGESS